MIISSGLGTASGTKNGGGVSNFTGGTLVVLGSLFSGNSAGGTGGGLYLNSGTVTLTNVTFSGNQTNTNGGGIRYGGTSLTMNNVTVTNNTADGDADGAGNGGGVYRISGTASFRNTLIAGNIDNSPTTKHPDCSGTWTSQGYNLVGNDTGCTFTTQTGDQRGTSGSPIDAKLGALQNNGGPTLTHALLSASPAIDKSNPTTPGSGGNACDAVDQRSYTRPIDGDGNGSVLCDTGAYELGASPFITITYIYDNLYRLTNATYSTGDVFTYTYDAVGNRLIQTTLTNTTVYTYDIANRLTNVGSQAYTWDNNGNLLNDGVFTYTYDFANRLSTLKQGTTLTYTYSYNGLGDRFKQVVNGVTTTYTLDLNAGLTQVLADGTNTYLYGNSRIAQYAGATPTYFLGDGLGSVRQLANSVGQVTLAKSYQPYGSVMSSAGAASSMYGFSGEQTDATNLIFLRARYYGSQWGRFLTADSWSGDYWRPLTLNKWNYTNGNPVNYTDPSGHCVFFVADTIACIIIWTAVATGVAFIGITIYNGPQGRQFARSVQVVVGVCERLLAPPILQPRERTGTGENPFALPYEYRAPEPAPEPPTEPEQKPAECFDCVPQILPTPRPESEFIYRDGRDNAKNLTIHKPRDWYTGLSLWDHPVGATYLKFRVSRLREKHFVVEFDGGRDAQYLPFFGGGTYIDPNSRTALPLPVGHVTVYHDNQAYWDNWHEEDVAYFNQPMSSEGSKYLYKWAER